MQSGLQIITYAKSLFAQFGTLIGNFRLGQELRSLIAWMDNSQPRVPAFMHGDPTKKCIFLV